MRLAHLSDIHVNAVFATLLRMWWGKRLLGGANMLLSRRRHMPNASVPLVVEHVLEQRPDAVLISGDLSTTSLKKEFKAARELIEPLCEAFPVVTIPGNHDVYTSSAQREHRYEKYFADLHGDSPSPTGYPFVRDLGEKVVCIGLNTSVPTDYFGAWGVLSEEQLRELPGLLEAHADAFRVVMIHHFLEDKDGDPGLPRRGLRNRDRLLDILHRYGAEVVLHGHEHAWYRYHVPGPHGPIPVLNSGPTTFRSANPLKQAGYQILHLEDGALTHVTRFGLQPDDTWSERSFSFPLEG